MLKEIIEEMLGLKRVRVGKVNPELGKLLKENKIKHEQAHKDIENQIKKFAKELKLKHQPVCDQLNAEEAELWEKIYDEVGLSEAERGESYSIDAVTGVVERIGHTQAGPIDREVH